MSSDLRKKKVSSSTCEADKCLIRLTASVMMPCKAKHTVDTCVVMSTCAILQNPI